MTWTVDFRQAEGVVFDFGGVISASPKALWETTLYPYCETLGLSREAVRAGFLRYRHLWDGGELSFEETYGRIFADAQLPRPSAAVLAELWRLDACSWVATLRADTLLLMKRLKACGKRVGILSNMSGDFFERLYVPTCGAYRALAEVEVISGLVRQCKPAPAIYALTSTKMGLNPAQLLFFDDTLENVVAARQCGWQAALYPAVLTEPWGI